MYKTFISILNLTILPIKMVTVQNVYNLLFHERIKAIYFAGYALTKCKDEPCAWKEIYEHKLKKLGVSEKTLANILKTWEKSGLIKKVTAPFPYRSKYKLVKEDTEFDLIKEMMGSVEQRRSQQYAIKLGENEYLETIKRVKTYEVAKISEEKRKEKLEEFSTKLKDIGREFIEDYNSLSKVLLLRLLLLGSKDTDFQMDEYQIAFQLFLFIDYLINSVSILFGESREEAIRILNNQIQEYIEKEEKIKPTKETVMLKKALNL